MIGDDVRPAVVVIKDEKIHQILSHSKLPADVGCEVRRLTIRRGEKGIDRRHLVSPAAAGARRGGQRGDAGRRGLPRSRQRTRPRRLGRLLERHQGGGGGRGDDHRGHAAVSWERPRRLCHRPPSKYCERNKQTHTVTSKAEDS